MGEKQSRTRREVLQRTGFASIGGVVSVLTATESGSARETLAQGEEIGLRDFVETDHTSYKYHLEAGHGIEYHDLWSNSDGTDYMHEIHHNSTGTNSKVDKSDGSKQLTDHTNSIASQTMSMDGGYANTALFDSQDPSAWGVMPESDGVSAGDLAATKGVIQTTLSAMSPGYTFALTASYIADLLTDDGGDVNGNVCGDCFETTWPYGSTGQPAEASHHAEFFVNPIDDCEGTHFDVTTDFGSFSAGTVVIEGQFQIDAPKDCGGLQSSTPAESQNWVQVSRDALHDRPVLRDRFDGPVYRALDKPPLKLVGKTVETTPAPSR